MGQFYVGTNKPSWLWGRDSRHPLFVSVRSLRPYKNLRPSRNFWCLDSGGFTELTKYDKWTTSPTQYIDEIYDIRDKIGNLIWASPQDWMCEPHMIQKTGLSVRTHQELTCENFVTLTELGSDLPIIPVLQGWSPSDYISHLQMYEAYGVDLRDYPTVGLGSFCRRANVSGVRELVIDLHRHGLKLHGFGLKKDGLRLFGDHLASSDSMAWSLTARVAGWEGRYLCGVPHSNAKSCADCFDWAMKWADDVAITQQQGQMMLVESLCGAR
jgi:hypothetical protein